MNFTPKTEEDIQRELLIPDGIYDFTVMEAVEKTSKKGNAMIEVKINVFSDQGDLHLYDYLLELMAFKLRHFCQAVGVLADYNLGRLEVDNIVGRSGKVKITARDEGSFGLRNVVKDYVPKDTPSEPETSPSEASKAVPDDLPF